MPCGLAANRRVVYRHGMDWPVKLRESRPNGKAVPLAEHTVEADTVDAARTAAKAWAEQHVGRKTRSVSMSTIRPGAPKTERNTILVTVPQVV